MGKYHKYRISGTIFNPYIHFFEFLSSKARTYLYIYLTGSKTVANNLLGTH